MLRATFRALLARKLRLALSSLAIVLGVAFVSGTFVLTDTLGRVFENLFNSVNKNTSVVVRTTTAFDSLEDDESDQDPVPQSLVEAIGSVAGVKEARGTLFAQGAVLVVDGTPYKTGGAPTAVIGIVPESALEAVLVKQGKPPAAADQVVIDATTVRKAELAIGDRVTVIGLGGRTDATLVGITGLEEADSFAGAALLGFQPAQAQRLAGLKDAWQQVEVAADDGVSQTTLRDRIAATLPQGTEAVTGAAFADEQASELGQVLSVFNTILLAFAGIALFVGAFLIFNTFSMLVAQRTRELALMRALGASRGQVTRSVLLEATLVGLVSSLVGFGLGIGVASGLRGLLNALGIGLPEGPNVIALRTFVVSLLVGVGITAVAALAPARRASRIPPVQAMRESGPAEERSLARRTLVGSVLLGLGVAALGGGLSGSGLSLVGVGAALSFLGVTVLSPLVARPVVRALGAPLARLGTPSRLGRGNAIRSPRRTSATAAALMIGLALVAMVSVFGQSAKTSLVNTVETSVGADYVLHTEQYDDFPPQVVTELRARKELAQVAAFPSTQFKANGKKVRVQGVDPTSLDDVLTLEVLGGSLAGLTDSQLAVSEGVADKRDLQVGSVVLTEWKNKSTAKLTVGAVFARNDFAGDYLVPERTYAEHVAKRSVVFAYLKGAPGVPLEQSRGAVESVLKGYPALQLEDQSEFIRGQSKQLDQLLNVVFAMLVLSVLIAVLGIVNTLALSVLERTRELGLLRAVGLQRRQLRRMIRVESVLIAIYGAVLGIVVGLAFGAALVVALHDQGITHFAVPYGRLVIVLLVGALAGVLAAALPARRAARLNVLEAIATA